jgi:hypothetical protein
LKHDKNWSTTDLEAAAIVYGVRKFRHLLWGCKFEIHTDHRALQWLESCAEKTARLARWFEFLSAFSYTLIYKKGSTHGNADGGSRNLLPATLNDRRREDAEGVLEVYAVEGRRWKGGPWRSWRNSAASSTLCWSRSGRK